MPTCYAYPNACTTFPVRLLQAMGDPVMKPFLQDVLQFGPLLRTMAAQVATVSRVDLTLGGVVHIHTYIME